MIFNTKPIKFSFESNIPKIGKELEAQRGFFSAFTAVSPQLERRLKYQGFKTHQTVEIHLEKTEEMQMCSKFNQSDKNKKELGIAETITVKFDRSERSK